MDCDVLQVTNPTIRRFSLPTGMGDNMKRQYGREIVAAVCQADAYVLRMQVRHTGKPCNAANCGALWLQWLRSAAQRCRGAPASGLPLLALAGHLVP